MSTMIDNTVLVTVLNKIHDNTLSQDDLPELRDIINDANVAYGDGYPIIEDSVYDVLRQALESIEPEDTLVTDTWEQSSTSTNDDFTEAISSWGSMLNQHPMLSIKTAKGINDSYYVAYIANLLNILLTNDSINLHFSYKINGHGIRLVYNNGELVSATSRARGGHGDNLLPLIKDIAPNHINRTGLIEIRGELCLPLSNLDRAREYNPDIKSALSAVTSLKASPSKYHNLLTILYYGYYEDGVDFKAKTDEYQFLSDLGFITPQYMTQSLSKDYDFNTISDIIQKNLSDFESAYDDFGYFCDGVVCTIDDYELFDEQPIEGSYSTGNIALKMGLWRQTGYVGIVKEIIWIPGKTVLNPVALVVDPNTREDGVLVSEGFRVKKVPLYNLSVIVRLNLSIGSYLCFNYGGESGVIPTFENGQLVTDKD